jgi:hypothetical protein
MLLALGALGYGLALPAVTVRGVTFDAHTLLVASLALLLGYQSVLFGLFSKAYAVSQKLLPEDPRLTRLLERLSLERGLLLGATSFAIGLLLLGTAIGMWVQADLGRLDYARTMRWVVPGVTICALGFQTILASFLVSLLGMPRR